MREDREGLIVDKTDSPPNWNKGRREFKATVPASRTKTDRDKVVEFALNWEVIKTRRMSHRDWIQWETDRARTALETAERALEDEPQFSLRDADALSSSLAHAITAWCRAHLGHAGPSDFDSRNAFLDNAPRNLSEIIVKASSSLHRMRWYAVVSPSEATAEVRAAVGAVLDAAVEH